MKKRLSRILGITMAAVLLAGCGTAKQGKGTGGVRPVHSGEVNRSSGQGKNLTEGKNTLTVEEKNLSEEEIGKLGKAGVGLFSEILSDKETGENTLISPTSIQLALGMTENGAAGKTLEQMEEYVNGGLSREDYNRIMAHLQKGLSSCEDVSWNVADSIWYKDSENMIPGEEFLRMAASYYAADVYQAPFSEETLNEINAWVKENTDQMIPKILDELPEDAWMYLINALAFEGEWEEEYEEEQILENREFTNADGSISDVTMLGSKEGRYFTLGQGEGFVKPYKGGEYAFVGILPKEGVTPEQYIAKLNASKEDFAKAVREASYEEVIVKIPEFTTDYDVELSNTYRKMGMNLPFEEKTADFTEMFESGNEEMNTWIGRILHKTHIEVDRKGTRAAAVTAVEMKCEAAVLVEEPLRIELDRPFVYAIVETETGLPVFLGCQNAMN